MVGELKADFFQIISHKANKMKGDVDYKSYYSVLLRELKAKTIEEAFIIGAIDAMIFDMAAALALGPAYMKSQARGQLIKKILS